MTIDNNTRDVVVAREDGIYYYGLHGRGPVFAYEGPKQSISIFKDYVAVVSPPQATRTVSTVARAATAPLRALGIHQADDPFSFSSFTVLNPDLKFISHQESVKSQIRLLFMEWDDLFMLTLDGKVKEVSVFADQATDHCYRYCDIEKRPSNNSLNYFSSEIYMSWQ
jgi:hypothetical protein